MTTRAVNKWFLFYSPLYGGQWDFFTSSAVPRHNVWSNALCLLGGIFWVRQSGGHNLRRRTGGDVPSLDDPIIGVANGAAATIKSRAYLAAAHAANGRYTYKITSVGGGGVEANNDHAVREVAMTALGALANPIPRGVSGLTVLGKANGDFVLTWRYVPKMNTEPPTKFRVYHDAGTGVIDFSVVAATVTYIAGVTDYTATIAGVMTTAWKRYEFAVRVAGANGEEKTGSGRTGEGASVATYGLVEITAEMIEGFAPELPVPT